MQRILISGASISGPALAWWLLRRGFTPTLIERAPGPRPGGHAIDVRGAALDVLRAMGLLEAAQDNRTRMKGVSMLDTEGKEVWRSDEMTISGGSFGKEAIEILRDDLSNILVSDLPAGTEIIYGDSITALHEENDGVLVSFGQGPARKFDLVVGADGLGSNTRKLAFNTGGEVYRPFGVALAPFSTPNMLGLEDWQVSYNNGKDSCMIYTARDNKELRACFGFAARLEDVPADRAGQMALVRKNCGHMGWIVPQLLDAMDEAPDFYLGPMAQVRMSHWTKGRVALVGDAGYCPSPYTGQGTSLALVGAYVLAWELAQSPGDHAAAFGRYEDKMRPYVEKNQALADLTRDERFSDPEYYRTVIEPAMDVAKDAIELEGLRQ